jgi:hypothetical protein
MLMHENIKSIQLNINESAITETPLQAKTNGNA